jgi:20S proteasome subunit beta 2
MDFVKETGFTFDARRNIEILSQEGIVNMATKTGTTISGIKYAEGIVLGADTRSTSGATVADKNCEKIHFISPNIYCCGAGTAADTEALTGLIASNLRLHQLSSHRTNRTITALTMLKTHLFKYQGNIGAALVLGGFDEEGAHLYTVYPHGSSDSLPFATMGSGSLAAMSIFESDYRDNMSEEEAKLLVSRSIKAGIFNDLGSGSNVDLCVISNNGTEYFRNYLTPNERTYTRSKGYDHPPGTTVLNNRNFTTATAATLNRSNSEVTRN